MADAIWHSHDSLTKAVFGDCARMRCFLRAFLPPRLIGRMDLSTLAPLSGNVVDQKLREHRGDLVFRLEVEDVGVPAFILLEHRSRAERLTALDVLRYGVAVLRAGGSPRSRLPALIPIVLYNGRHRWSLGNRVRDILAPKVRCDPELLPYQPDLGFLLVDLGSVPDATLEVIARVDPFAGLALLLLKHWHTPDLGKRIASWIRWFRSLLHHPDSMERFGQLVCYVYAKTLVSSGRLRKILGVALGPDAEELIMTTAERLIAKGEAKGEAKGRAEGRAEGRDEGRLETLRSTLSALLTARYRVIPAEFGDRIASAPPADLERWLVRFATAERLEGVFGD